MPIQHSRLSYNRPLPPRDAPSRDATRTPSGVAAHPPAAPAAPSLDDIRRGLASELIAEGIATPAQRQHLLAMGCRIGQGFGLALPMARETLLRHLAPAPAALAAPHRTAGGSSSRPR